MYAQSVNGPEGRALVRDLLRNLLSGAAAWTFFLPRPAAWRASPLHLFLLVGLDIAVAAAAALLVAGSPGDFQWDALPRALFPIPLALAAGLAVAWRARVPNLWLSVATILLATIFWLDLATNAIAVATAFGAWADDAAAVDWPFVLFVWWAIASGVAVMRFAPGPAWGRLADFGWTAVIVAVPLWWVPPAALWLQPVPESTEPDTAEAGREDVIYAQGRLLHNLAVRLAPQRPGVEDVFFVGAAGYADEDVFLNEVTLAAEMIRTRYDADGHVALLSNNPRTVQTLPLASATSLAQTLRAVGRVMDVDEDVLFLFLTTHGGEDHTLAMQFWPLQLAGITPQMLSRMLDDAGIKWRVIVVSACYAGGFVAPLRNDRTMVITAADAFNQSFGCGSDSDLTYFGKAYFDEALRETFSFAGAFEKARVAIGERERESNYRPSNPEIFVGEAIGTKLERIARRMEGSHGRHAHHARCGPGADAGGAACGGPLVRAN